MIVTAHYLTSTGPITSSAQAIPLEDGFGTTVSFILEMKKMHYFIC